MKVSRREFVSTAAYATATSLCALPTFGFAASDSGAQAGARCTLLDLEANCALPESLAGMRATLGDAHRSVTEIVGNGADSVVVPAAGAVRPEMVEAVRELLGRGSTVFWESGAAFLKPGEFARQQVLMLEHFGISMQRPIDVWSQSASRRASAGAKKQTARSMRAIGHEQIPYVAYRWPKEVQVREFSRVIPVSAANGRAIAHWREISVAWRQPVGAGTFIFVGSPIGPALRAGDSDAASLLRSMIAI